MKRLPFRFLGIAMGLLIGTTLAMLVIAVRRAKLRSENATLALRESDGTLQSDADTSESVALSNAALPDPGRRRQLQELAEASASEPNWTRAFELTERSGETVRSEDLRGQPYVVCFFFSTCPGTCKRQSGEMRLLQSKFKGQPIKLVSISVDPEVDTPELLREYAEGFGADPKQWLFLTGELENIIKVGSEMFFLPGVERRGHPDRFCLVDAEGRLVGSYIWLDPDERQSLIQHIEALLAETADSSSGVNAGSRQDAAKPDAAKPDVPSGSAGGV